MDRLAEKNWRDEGHPLVGQRVRRFLGGDRAANGRIIQWLPAGRYFPLRPRLSTFVNLARFILFVSFRSDEEQMPALFRIRHDLTRSQEDVSEVEVATHPQTPQSRFCTRQFNA